MPYLTYILFFNLSVFSVYGDRSLSSVIVNLGWKFVDVVHDEQYLIFKKLSEVGIQVRYVNVSDVQVDHFEDFSYPNVIFFINDFWRDHIEILFDRDFHPEKLMIISEPTHDYDEELQNFLVHTLHSRAFLKLLCKDYNLANCSLSRVQTTKHEAKFVEHDMQWSNSFNKFDFKKLDYQGLSFKLDGKLYSPYHVIYDDKYGNQIHDGFAIALFNHLAHSLNFSISLDLNFDKEFGSIPISGSWKYPNATFTGVLKAIIDGTQDSSASAWLFQHERIPWIDYSVPIMDMIGTVVINRKTLSFQEHDLFLRPFSVASWIGLGGTLALGLLLMVWIIWHPPNSNWPSHKQHIIFVLWICYLLANSYYCGALTTFFSSPARAPFSSLKEGLQKWPEWKGNTFQGNEVTLFNRAQSGN